MAENTEISWTDHTWSPWYGCTQVSMGEHGACVGCYARHLSETRMGRVVFGGPGRGEGTRDARADSGWKEPLKWNRDVEAETVSWLHTGEHGPMPTRFVFPSMCDPFDNHPDLPPLFRRFMRLIYDTPRLTWLLLTKRPGNIVKLFHDFTTNEIDGVVCRPPLADLIDLWPRNAAIGCTVVTQEEADRDIPKLLAAKAALDPAFALVSMEPLLGPVDLTRIRGDEDEITDVLRGEFWTSRYQDEPHKEQHLDWVITGGETDQGSHKARPSHPDWFRSLRDQCAAAGVAYHHKQNGEWAPAEVVMANCDGKRIDGIPDKATGTYRVGKKTAGRLLDGVTHDARPEVRR